MNNQCDCSQCANWEDCEIKMVVHNPITEPLMWEGVDGKIEYTINKGDKIGQLILKRHEGYLIPQEYTLDAERSGGFGSTGQADRLNSLSCNQDSTVRKRRNRRHAGRPRKLHKTNKKNGARKCLKN